jgi:hypothetical protein
MACESWEISILIVVKSWCNYVWAPIIGKWLDESTMSDPVLIFLPIIRQCQFQPFIFFTNHSTMSVRVLYFLPIIRQCRFHPFINRSFDNVGSSPSFFFIRKELRTKTIFHIVIYTSIDWVTIGEFLHLNRWIDNIVKIIFLQTIIRLYLLMVLTDNSICRSSDLVFKRQTDNAVSKVNR